MNGGSASPLTPGAGDATQGAKDDVPGTSSDSPPPDPVVSPADTIRRQLGKLSLDETGYHPDQAKEQRLEALASLNALLAVGERDKAAIEQMHEHIAGMHDLNDRLLAQVERDRQQIARLTEALREIAKGELWTGDMAELAAAVLADEEDAP